MATPFSNNNGYHHPDYQSKQSELEAVKKTLADCQAKLKKLEDDSKRKPPVTIDVLGAISGLDRVANPWGDSYTATLSVDGCRTVKAEIKYEQYCKLRELFANNQFNAAIQITVG